MKTTFVPSSSAADGRPVYLLAIPVTGNPQGVITAPPGQLAVNVNTGSAYAKLTGTGNTGWQAISGGGGGGASRFTQLTDVPSSYAGANGQGVVVNSAATGLVFQPIYFTFSATGNSEYIGGDQSGNGRGISALDVSSLRQLDTQVASGIRTVLFGINCTASGKYSLVLGSGSMTSSPYDLAAGYSATASGGTSIAIGKSAAASTGFSIAIGFQSVSSGANNSVALGSEANSTQPNATALGAYSQASGVSGVAIGPSAHAGGANSGAIGSNSTASADYSLAFGAFSNVSGKKTMIAGYQSTATGQYSVAVGNTATANGNFSAVIGSGATTNSEYTTAIGFAAATTATGATAVGSQAHAYSENSLAVGPNATTASTFYKNTAIGFEATSASDYSTALGFSSDATVPRTTNIRPPIINSRDDSSGDDPYTSWGGVRVVLMTPVVSLKSLGTQTLTIPGGAHFYADECGVIVTSATTVTGQPTIEFGVTGSNASLLAATAGSGLTAAFARQRFQTLLTAAGQTTLTATVTIAATGTTLMGRFYFEGLLVADQ